MIGDIMKRSYSLLISIVIPIMVAGITYTSIYGNQHLYTALLLPEPLTLSSFIYLLFWGIQYLLLGFSSHRIYISKDKDARKLLIIYSIQLLLLFLWPIIFFNIRDYLLTTMVLLCSWGIALNLVYMFYKTDKIASYLLIPHFIWLSYMMYYHFQIFMLN